MTHMCVMCVTFEKSHLRTSIVQTFLFGNCAKLGKIAKATKKKFGKPQNRPTGSNASKIAATESIELIQSKHCVRATNETLVWQRFGKMFKAKPFNTIDIENLWRTDLSSFLQPDLSCLFFLICQIC